MKMTVNLSKYKTPAAAAKALYKFLVSLADEIGGGSGSVRLLSPKDSASAGMGNCWHVSWEDGPYEWGIRASMGGNIFGEDDYSSPTVKVDSEINKFYLEPYYSFDVGFTPL